MWDEGRQIKDVQVGMTIDRYKLSRKFFDFVKDHRLWFF